MSNPLSSIIGALGGTAAQVGAGAVSAIIGGNINENFSERAEERAYERQLDMYQRMYHDNSPANKRAQLEQAGLNPALMYGGTTSAGGGTVQTGSPVQGTVNTKLDLPNILEINQVMKQNELMSAQIAKTEEEARLAKVQADKLAGADTDNVNANTALTKINTKAREIDVEIANATKENVIETAEAQLAKLTNEAENLMTEGQILEANKDNIVKETAARVINIAVDTALKSNEIKLNSQKISNLKTEIDKIITETKAIQFNAVTNRFEANTDRLKYGLEINKIKIETLLQQEGYDQKHVDAIIGVIGTVLGASVIGGMTKGNVKGDAKNKKK